MRVSGRAVTVLGRLDVVEVPVAGRAVTVLGRLVTVEAPVAGRAVVVVGRLVVVVVVDELREADDPMRLDPSLERCTVAEGSVALRCGVAVRTVLCEETLLLLLDDREAELELLVVGL